MSPFSPYRGRPELAPTTRAEQVAKTGTAATVTFRELSETAQIVPVSAADDPIPVSEGYVQRRIQADRLAFSFDSHDRGRDVVAA